MGGSAGGGVEDGEEVLVNVLFKEETKKRVKSEGKWGEFVKKSDKKWVKMSKKQRKSG